MKPLPRLLALTDDRVAALADLPQRAAAIAAVGPAIALVARVPDGTTDQLASLADRLMRLARPSMAWVFVSRRADVAAAVGAPGVLARAADLTPAAMRQVFTTAGAMSPTIFRSVHTLSEAEAAVVDSVDGIVAGSIWPTRSHPGIPPAGIELVDRIARLGVPVWAIGGVTPERAHEARDAGAWGVASISNVWDATDPNHAALALLEPWRVPEEH